ncbi:MAG: cytochrome c oxidase subunit II [Betaproteobacteria bacterium]
MQGLNKFGLGLAAALGSAATLAGYSWNFPEPVTPIARETLHVHNLFMIVILVIFFAVLAIMLYSFWTHRKSRGQRAADFVGPKSGKQWFWVLLPFAGLLILDYGVFGIPAYHAVLSYEDTRTDADLVVRITGSQWLWQYEYPSEGIKFNSRLTTPRAQIDNLEPKGENYLLEVDNPLVLPAGKKIRFITTSNDVIHSWWVPAFGVKRDAVPGFLREFWATVDKPGIYRGQCSELCGKEHGFMPAVVQVVSQQEFKTWLASKKGVVATVGTPDAKPLTLDELKAKGEKVYAATCVACHQASGMGVPGAFPALNGSKVATGAADVHIKTVLNGRPGTAMVAFGKQLSDADIAAVVTYERNAWDNKVGDTVQALQVTALKAAP